MTEHDPAETQWHHWPRCWYPAARVHGFAPGQVRSGRLGAREWVLYRDADGTFRATDAFCPHMGAHLKSARVEGQALCCGLHGCLIEPQTALSDGLPPIRPGCRIGAQAWPCAERFGLVWLHPPLAEGETAPPLPFADNSHLRLTASRTINADWRAMICNGFDLSHMAIVHQRTPEGNPVFDTPPEGGIRMRFATRILPKGGFSSWLMQRLSGGRVELAHTCNGSSIMVESRVGRFRASGIFALLPQDAPGTPPEERSTLAFAAIGIPPDTLFPRLQLYIARFLYLAFLKKDFVIVKNMRLKLDGADDPGVQQAARYQSTLESL